MKKPRKSRVKHPNKTKKHPRPATKYVPHRDTILGMHPWSIRDLPLR